MIERYFEDQAIRNENNQNTKKVKAYKALKIAMIVLSALTVFFIWFVSPAKFLESEELQLWQKILIIVLQHVPIVAFVFMWIFAHKRVAKLTEEFDYILNGRELKIVRVMESKRRKLFLTIELTDIEVMGKVECDSYDKMEATPGIKKVFAVANPNDLALIYYAVYNSSKGKRLLHFEPSAELLREIRMSLGRELVQKN